ncbi:MAG: hypothetical protein JO212_17840 [Acetobacteraceae bacterium]|nr:hypothetical protein [Acetobacteraceae bacterium]
MADSNEPGSVIVWPKFMTGSVAVNAGTPGAFTAAKTVIELGAVCPADTGGSGCADNSTINVHLHWVCPGVAVGELPSVCPSTDFTVAVTYGNSSAGKITINPSEIFGPAPSDYNGSTAAALAPCPRGYLIGWAVDKYDNPIVFNGLVGDAVLRDFGTDLQSYKAITIQGNGTELSPISLGKGGALVFDGANGHYQAVTGQITTDVSFDSNKTPPFHNEALVFLSLDVNAAGGNNDPVVVDLDFYNYYEQQLSTSYQFTCWGQVELSAGLDPNLTVEAIGSAFGASPRHDKGILISGQAFDPLTNKEVTLLGLVETTEGPAPGPWAATTSYDIQPGNNAVPIPTSFVPLLGSNP